MLIKFKERSNRLRVNQILSKGNKTEILVQFLPSIFDVIFAVKTK